MKVIRDAWKKFLREGCDVTVFFEREGDQCAITNIRIVREGTPDGENAH
ncbi:MAG: hypothetical protein K6G16_10605 [Lachnospiraceae bacterium]|nr:hypothetical protein [Lachnospiraceae bacterium]